MPLELRQYNDLSRHIKEPQNAIYCLNFLKKDNFKANRKPIVFSNLLKAQNKHEWTS